MRAMRLLQEGGEGREREEMGEIEEGYMGI